jgi:hypothetical protein
MNPEVAGSNPAADAILENVFRPKNSVAFAENTLYKISTERP